MFITKGTVADDRLIDRLAGEDKRVAALCIAVAEGPAESVVAARIGGRLQAACGRGEQGLYREAICRMAQEMAAPV